MTMTSSCPNNNPPTLTQRNTTFVEFTLHSCSPPPCGATCTYNSSRVYACMLDVRIHAHVVRDSRFHYFHYGNIRSGCNGFRVVRLLSVKLKHQESHRRRPLLSMPKLPLPPCTFWQFRIVYVTRYVLFEPYIQTLLNA